MAELTASSDEYCPNCDNHFVLDAVTPQAKLQVEGEDVRKDARYGTPTLSGMGMPWEPRTDPTFRMLKDERVRGETERSIFNVKDASDRLG